MEKIWIELVTEDVKINQLSWPGYVLQKVDGERMKRSMLYEVDGVRGKGRLRLI